MGMTVSDVVTSAPSVWGAANAATAATVSPLAAVVAVSLAAVVSDPAQIWHAGQRYGHVADRLRTANTEITQAVTRHASADKWNEKGKQAFLTYRVEPYQKTLGRAADVYDDMRGAMFATATFYTAAGLTSAVVGAAMLQHVAEQLAAAVVPGANVATTVIANERMIEAVKVVRQLVGGLAKANARAASVIAKMTQRLVALTAGSAGVNGLYIGAVAKYTFSTTETTLNWPKQVVPGEAVPAGYRAPSAADNDAIKRIRPASITALGRDLDTGAARTLADAYDLARGNDVGYPGFGVMGLHLAHAHSQMRHHAAEQLAACRDRPGTWLPGLRTTAGNWVAAEHASVNDSGWRIHGD
jgi:hypothetical protein